MSSVQAARGMRVSISALAAEFGMDRKTVARRLGEAGVEPSGQLRGYDVYRLRDAVKALFRMSVERSPPTDDGNGDVDPTRLPPNDRKAWYQSENERLKYETTKRYLIPASEHEQGIADVLKICVQVLQTVPDRLERECRLPPAAVALVTKSIDTVCDGFYRELAGEDDGVEGDEKDDEDDEDEGEEEDGELRIDG